MSFMCLTPLFARQLRASGRARRNDLMIAGFDNQRASSAKANASKIRLNAPKR
jgi:hypothetical protein